MKPFRLSASLFAQLAMGALLGTGMAAPALAVANPPIQMAQGIEFMCGGKNAEEAAFMERVSPRWAATLEFAIAQAPRGQFTESVQVRVVDKNGNREVMKTQSSGPFMLARLAPGTYEVQATLGQSTLTRSLSIALGAPGRTLFVWPSNANTTASMPPQALAQGQ